MKYQDYYQTLGIGRDASQDEIKRAYRKQAHKFHPDVSKAADAEERFKEVGEAYEVLKDPEKRSAYDRLGPNWKAGQEFRPPPGFGGGGFRSEFRGGFGNDDPFSDFFNSLFRQQGAGAGGGATRGGSDRTVRLKVGLEEAYRGSERSVHLSDGRTLKVKVPKGVTSGQKIRLSGQGGTDFDGSKGDLFLEVEVSAHPWFSVNGRDVHLTLPVTPWEAALGASVKVPTLGGAVDLKIPAGSESGRKMRLRGRGLGAGDAAGDQYIVLQIVAPAPANDEERAMYESMAETFTGNPRDKLGV